MWGIVEDKHCETKNDRVGGGTTTYCTYSYHVSSSPTVFGLSPPFTPPPPPQTDWLLGTRAFENPDIREDVRDGSRGPDPFPENSDTPTHRIGLDMSRHPKKVRPRLQPSVQLVRGREPNHFLGEAAGESTSRYSPRGIAPPARHVGCGDQTLGTACVCRCRAASTSTLQRSAAASSPALSTWPSTRSGK